MGGGAVGRSRSASAQRAKYATLIGYSRITAPFAGVVTQRYADTGSLVGAGTASNSQALVRLSQLDPLRLVLPVPESAVPKITDGAPIDVHVQATGRDHLRHREPQQRRRSDRTRTMHVEVDVPNPQLRLAPGMYATATLVQDSRKNALAIPVEAAPNRKGDTATVLVLDSAAQDRRAPDRHRHGNADAARSEVGVEEDELVLLGGRGQYQPGQIAEPKL